jgi:hypothetical protein
MKSRTDENRVLLVRKAWVYNVRPATLCYAARGGICVLDIYCNL